MISFKIISCPLKLIRKYSAKVKPVVTADENVLNNIENCVYKARKHPGIISNKTVKLPDEFVKAVVAATEDYPVKRLVATSEIFARHLKGRVSPMEKDEVAKKVEEARDRVLKKYKDVVIESEEDEKRFKQKVIDKVNYILKRKIYNWKPISYNAYNSLLYLITRSAAEYAVLVKIFGEIVSRDPNFKPKSLFDFGSGVGTVTWAAQNYWKKSIFEYFNVDSSREMNDLACILLQGGKGTGNLPKGTFYRQFLPASKVKYDLVVSAYSLLETPNFQSRIQTIVNLWNKTDKYLIIVEQGTNAGFKIINEIRDFILDIKDESNKGHVFSPCPHDDVCPRFLLDDGTPCNFEVNYFTIPVAQISQSRKELYSYVVLKRGKRSESDLKWPRLVRPTLVRPRHTICRMCTAEGKLGEVIFTASKHGKTTYHCARSSNWGDLLPLTVNFEETELDEALDDDCDSNTEVIDGHGATETNNLVHSNREGETTDNKEKDNSNTPYCNK